MPNNTRVKYDSSDKNFESSWVEKNMDSGAYTVAHPDDSIIFCGPARIDFMNMGNGTNKNFKFEHLSILGFVQGINFSESAGTQFIPSIGTARKYPIKSTVQSSFSIGRIILNHDNLLKAIYNSMLTQITGDGSDTNTGDQFKKQFKGMADGTEGGLKKSNIWMDMSNALTYVPFGLGIFMRNKQKSVVGGLYMEHCLFNSFNLQAQAGMGQIMENMSGVCDRIVPFDVERPAQNNSGLTTDETDFWKKVDSLWLANED